MCKKIALIGGGPVAVLAMQAIAHQNNTLPFDITIFDPNPPQTLGRGTPYIADAHSTWLMNAPAQTLGVKDETDFMSWLQNHFVDIKNNYAWVSEFKDQIININNWNNEDLYVPRALYGDYLHEKFMELVAQLNVEIISLQVSDISKYNGKMRLSAVDVKTKEVHYFNNFDDVIVATGSALPQTLPWVTLGQEVLHLNQFAQWLPANTANASEYSVVVVGAGLSALDATVAAANYPFKEVILVSRSGLHAGGICPNTDLTAVPLPYFTELLEHNSITADQAMSAIEQDISHNSLTYVNAMQTVIQAILDSPHRDAVYKHMSPDEQEIFIMQYNNKYKYQRYLSAPQTQQDFKQKVALQRIKITNHYPKNQQNIIVINCTGPQHVNPLLQNICTAFSEHFFIGARGGLRSKNNAQCSIYPIGFADDSVWENTSINQLRPRIDKIVKTLLQETG